MKTIGLIGGVSWESTAIYYHLINTLVKQRLGGFHSARCLLYSVDFQDIIDAQNADDWDQVGAVLAGAARALEKGGADFMVLCANTMHKKADSISAAVTIPLLHIADVTADAVLRRGFSTVALLGTKYTMEEDYLKQRLADRGLTVLVPDAQQRTCLNDIIYDELCQGILRDTSKTEYLAVIDDMAAQGAEGVILGCTEIGLLVTQEDTAVPLFDTTRLHATAAVEAALA